MRTRTTPATFLLSFFLLATAATASARPDILPTTSEQTLPGFRGGVLFSRVTPNTAIDVIFNNTDTWETWRWDVSNQSARPITAPAPDYIKVGRAHGHFAAIYRIGTFDIFDFRTNQLTYHAEANIGTEGLDIHGQWMAWREETSGIRIFNLATGFETILFPGYGVDQVSIHADWLTFELHPYMSPPKTILLQLSTMQEHVVAPIPGVPHVGSGKLIWTEPERFTWEYIGQPQTRKSIHPPTDCRATKNHQLGGTRSQLLAYVATGCSSGDDEFHVLNLHTGATFLVEPTPITFSFESNVIAFSDESEQLRVITIDETRAK